MKPPNITHLENTIYLVTEETGFGQYDFCFEDHFECRHPHYLDDEITAIARMGAAPDYKERYEQMLEFGVKLVHTPEQYGQTSLLPTWYPLIEEFTPKSIWYDSPPDFIEIETNFDYPIFIKGERQTAKHNGNLAIIQDREHYSKLTEQWKKDPILWWQRIVCRDFHPLQPAKAKEAQSAMPKSYEFRTFWWKGQCVGIGRYWVAVDYQLDPSDKPILLEIGKQVTQRIPAPLLVIDFAKTLAGEWIVIECNDGQDSGYAGVKAVQMWRNILDIEQEK